MSTRRGGTAKGPPKHQNNTTWKPNRAVKKKETDLGGKLNPYPPVIGMCVRCRDQVEWKRKYGKYKPLKEPAKCVRCTKRAVRQPYTSLCTACASVGNLCVKCCRPASAIVGSGAQKEQEEREQLEAALVNLRERERRTLLRAMAKGSDTKAVMDMSAKIQADRGEGCSEDDDSESEITEESDTEEDDDGEQGSDGDESEDRGVEEAELSEEMADSQIATGDLRTETEKLDVVGEVK